MDGHDDPADLLSVVSTLLMIFLNTHNNLATSSIPAEAPTLDEFNVDLEESVRNIDNIHCTLIAAWYSFQLCNNLILGDIELGYWVKSRSTTWFSRFVIEDYNDEQWSSLFRMTKSSVFELSHQLQPLIEKQNTKYRLAIIVIVRVACTLLNLAHATNTHMSRKYAVSKFCS